MTWLKVGRDNKINFSKKAGGCRAVVEKKNEDFFVVVVFHESVPFVKNNERIWETDACNGVTKERLIEN